MELNQLGYSELINLRDSIQEKIENSDELIFSNFLGVAGFMPDCVELEEQLRLVNSEIMSR